MQGSQQRGSESSYDIIWILALIFGITYGFWHLYQEQIVFVIFKIKLFQAEIIDLFTDNLDLDIVVLQTAEPGSVFIGDVINLSMEIGAYFKYISTPILLLLAYFVYKKNIAFNYSNKYSMVTLAKKETVNWPQITPVLDLDLVNQDIMKGPWSMSLSPMEFAKKHSIIKVIKNEAVGRSALPATVELLYAPAKQLFINQLGRLWTGANDIPIYARALLAIFAARINRQKKDADLIIKQLAVSSGTNKTMNYAGVDELLTKHLQTKLVTKVISSHAYYLTVMSAMLDNARADGVVASADFLWLKPLDRKLWYTLNSIGRQTPFVEVAGPFAHWVAEKTYGAPIKIPMVDTAVSALDFALSEIIYKEDN